jgi:perosamine synthetase
MTIYPISKPSITNLEKEYVNKALDSGWISSMGEFLNQFELKWANYCNANYCVSASNGTTGLFLALLALEIGPGDEVILPDFSFIASANVICQVGAKPVFVDINENNLCIDSTALINAINVNTKAIMPVHIYGHPAPMHEIIKIAEKFKLKVIEDCAEAHGAEVNGQKVGTWGDAGVFSFYGNKIFTTGEGGAIFVKDKAVAERIKFLRDHAMSNKIKYWHEEVGYNFRMTNLQAAFGLAQIERADEIISKKITIFNWYKKYLSGVKKIKLNYTEKWAKNVYWMVCIELIDENVEFRNDFIIKLKEKGVETRPFFFPMSNMPMYENANTPVTQKKSNTGINLPSYFDLTEEDVIQITNKIIELL